MSQFTKTNGGTRGVLNYDVGSSVNQFGNYLPQDGLPVQAQGPKLQFWRGTVTVPVVATPVSGTLPATVTALSPHFAVDKAIEQILRVVAELGTIHLYQFDVTGDFCVVTYATSTDDAAALEARIQAIGVVPAFQTRVVDETTGLGITINVPAFDLTSATVSAGSLI